MNSRPKPFVPQTACLNDPEAAEEAVMNDSLGTIDTSDSTGDDEELETGDAKAKNLDTRED